MEIFRKPTKKRLKKMLLTAYNRESFFIRFHKMRTNKEICFTNLARFLSPQFKTIHSENLLIIRMKGTKKNCHITRLFTGWFKYDKITYFEVTTSFSPVVFEFVCSSHKELLKKLIKHDLI